MKGWKLTKLSAATLYEALEAAPTLQLHTFGYHLLRNDRGGWVTLLPLVRHCHA